MPTPTSYETLLQRYIEICSEVVERCQDRFPYRVIFRAAADEGQAPVLLAVYDDDPKATQAVQLEVMDEGSAKPDPGCTCGAASKAPARAAKVIAMAEDGAHVTFHRTDADGQDTCRVVRLPLSEIRSVVDDPDRVLENPGLIDWSWLQAHTA